MKGYHIITVVFLMICLEAYTLSAQNKGLFCEWRETELVIHIDRRASEKELTAFLDEMNLNEIHLDSLFQFGTLGQLAQEGWLYRKVNRHIVELYKPDGLDALPFEDKSVLMSIIDEHRWHTFDPNAHVNFGVNQFKKTPSVIELEDGFTLFTVAGYSNAASVHLAGSFNDWRTQDIPLKLENGVWKVMVKLNPGKHLYKFIIDGRKWIYDESNALREADTYNSYNSVYYKYNHEFKLEGYPKAKKVLLTGSFLNWNRRGTPMKKTENGWYLPLYLGDGTHTYKFIVDRKWIADPDNPNTFDDGIGSRNSYVSIGNTIEFNLNGFSHAREVFVAGNFNLWNFRELPLNKTASGWAIPYVLPAGNYEYKFKVDDLFLIDPENPYTSGHGDYTNSVMAVKPNHTFLLSGYAGAKQVFISGTFNNWNEQGYRMKKSGDDWVIDLHLKSGKHQYKFIVDGEWLIDPNNPYYQDNEHGTFNSVIWIDRLKPQ